MKQAITITWHVDDVMSRIKALGFDYSEVVAARILEELKKFHDASIGINWTVIDDRINLYRNMYGGN